MSESCGGGCGGCEQSCPSNNKPIDLTIKPHKLSKIGKIIGVVSGKGGVGKSSVTALLAVSMQRLGYRVAILDADITGPSIPQAFGIDGKVYSDENGIYPLKSKGGIEVMSVNLLLPTVTSPVIWRGPFVSNMVKQFFTDVIWKDIDYMFIDMPPGTSDVPLTVFESISVDGIVIVTSPQQLVSMIVSKAVEMAKTMNIKILGLVENMSYFECPDNHKQYKIFGDSHIDDVANKYEIPIIAKLPIDPNVATLCDEGKIEDFNKNPFDNVKKFFA